MTRERRVNQRRSELHFDEEHHPSCCGTCDECLRICDGYHGPERRRPSIPGLPSSFPVGSVSGSPKLPHAYNVEPLEEEG